MKIPVYHDHQKQKCMSVPLPFISIPNYVDYVSIPVQIAHYFVGPAFYPGFMNHRTGSLLLCISFRVKEYFMFSLIYTSSEGSSLFFVCLAFSLFVMPRNFAAC